MSEKIYIRKDQRVKDFPWVVNRGKPCYDSNDPNIVNAWTDFDLALEYCNEDYDSSARDAYGY